MTKAEYTDYERRVGEFQEKYTDMDFLERWEGRYEEFSIHRCECCGTRIAGERLVVYAKDPKFGMNDFQVCCDCHHYLQHGQLDDLTMLDMEVNHGTRTDSI